MFTGLLKVILLTIYFILILFFFLIILLYWYLIKIFNFYNNKDFLRKRRLSLFNFGRLILYINKYVISGILISFKSFFYNTENKETRMFLSYTIATIVYKIVTWFRWKGLYRKYLEKLSIVFGGININSKLLYNLYYSIDLYYLNLINNRYNIEVEYILKKKYIKDKNNNEIIIFVVEKFSDKWNIIHLYIYNCISMFFMDIYIGFYYFWFLHFYIEKIYIYKLKKVIALKLYLDKDKAFILKRFLSHEEYVYWENCEFFLYLKKTGLTLNPGFNHYIFENYVEDKLIIFLDNMIQIYGYIWFS